MMVLKAFKYRLYPNAEQRAFLARQFGCACFVYDHFLKERLDYYAVHMGEKKQGLNYGDTARRLVELKRQPGMEWLQAANSQVLQQSLMNLDAAYRNFFEKRADFPRFKRKHDKQAFRIPQHFTLAVEPGKKHGHVCLPKMTPIWIRVHRPVEGRLKSVTVTHRPSGAYCAAILCEVDLPDPEPARRGKAIGLDLGLKRFVVTSDGEKIGSPAYLRQSERKLARFQRQLSHKQPGSTNRIKAKLRVATLHHRVANQRADFLHKLSRRLIADNQAIYVERLNVKGLLANHSLAKSVSDAGWSEFLRQLQYKGAWAGRTVEAIDRFYPSSRPCRKCGYYHADLTLVTREWDCPSCHAHHDRDENAAGNILDAGLAHAREPITCRAGTGPNTKPGETRCSKTLPNVTSNRKRIPAVWLPTIDTLAPRCFSCRR